MQAGAAMVSEFRFPDVGEGITEGTIRSLDVSVGDSVEEDQVLGSVETDKAVVDMPAPASGVVMKLYAGVGDVIKVGDLVAAIDDGIHGPAPLLPEKDSHEASAPKTNAELAPAAALAPSVRAKALLRTRKIAQSLNVDIDAVAPTGLHGEVTENDVRNAAAPGEKKRPKLKLSYDLYGKVEHIPYKGVRKVIGDKLSQSIYSAPHAVAMDEADVTELWVLWGRKKVQAKEEGIRLTPLSFIVMAVVRCLKAHLTLNAHFDEAEHDIIVKKYCNIGFATDTPDGLKVPVIKRADLLGLFEIQQSINELAEKARTKEIDLADMRGSSFSITNYGSIGGYFGVPIINLGDVAILGIGKAKDVVALHNGAVCTRKMMGLSVSFDHRVNDGAEVARFLRDLIGMLEHPAEIFL